jgi:putative protease
MKIVAPLSSESELQELIEIGVDEFYCGINASNSYFTNNRREMEKANINFIDELARIVNICRKNDIPINITLNKIFYIQKELLEVIKLINVLIDLKIDGIIVADLGLIKYLFDSNFDKILNIQLSSVATTLNTKSIEFYRRFNFKRIILPRHLSLKEINLIRKYNPDIEIEVFILNWSCMNIDGLCNTQHDLTSCSGAHPDNTRNNQCCLNYDIQLLWENQMNEEDKTHILHNVKDRFTDVALKSSRTCGACFLYDLKYIGIQHVKIVGRLLGKTQKIQSLKFIKECLYLLSISKTRQDYALKVQEIYNTHFGFHSPHNCYFKLLKNGKRNASFSS